MGRRGIRDLKTRAGQESSISRGGLYCTLEVYSWRSPRRESQCYEWGHSRWGSSKSEICQEF